MPQKAITDEEVLACFDVMSELRTALVKEHFLLTIRHLEAEGYNLVFLKEKDSGNIVAAAGYRIYSNLFMGKHFYIDDLITSKLARSNGYGEKMLMWLREQAKENECQVFHLDSGTHRSQAHKFYFKQGLNIASFHFSEQLNDK